MNLNLIKENLFRKLRYVKKYLLRYWGYNVLIVAGALAFSLHKNCSVSVDKCLDLELEFWGKTWWDWIELLVAPLIFTIAGVVIKGVLDSHEEERKRHDALKDYLEDITKLFLSEIWSRATASGIPSESLETERVAAIAKARTLAAFNELNKPRQIVLIQFLADSQQLKHFQLPGAGLNLEGVNLSGLNLEGANLSGANLEGAYLSGANLEGAYLSGVNLAEANLSGANLEGAYLSGANLAEANLQGAYLIEADLADANLEKANLALACLEGAYLSGANLRGANLSVAIMQGAFMHAAHLEGAALWRADLAGANLYAAHLAEANLNFTFLAEANLSGANLEGANLSEANLEGAHLRETNLEGAYLSETNLKGANLNEINLKGVIGLNQDQLTQALLCRIKLPSDIPLDPNRNCEEMGFDPETGKYVNLSLFNHSRQRKTEPPSLVKPLE